MIPILLFTVLSLGSIHADILNDVILTPFSWTDNECEKEIEKPVNRKIIIGQGRCKGVKVFKTLTYGNKRVLMPSIIATLADKNSDKLSASELKIRHNIMSLNEYLNMKNSGTK